MISEFINRQSPFLALLIICLISRLNIQKHPESFNRRYKKLSAEAKTAYDIEKIKTMGKLSNALMILTLAVFICINIVFSQYYNADLFFIIFLFELAVLLLLSETRWALDAFCKI